MSPLLAQTHFQIIPGQVQQVPEEEEKERVRHLWGGGGLLRGEEQVIPLNDR